MKFLFVFLNFLYFTCLSISAQDSKENIFNSIKENYQSKAFDCCILSSEGKWYFVTAVGNQKRSSFWGQLAGYYPKQMSLSDHAIKQKAREQVINFFVGKSMKKYINYTRLPKNMENLEDLEAVYERLHKSKKCFYSMPLIGSAGTDIYFFAKAITDEAISQGEDTQERTNSSSFNIAARDTNKPNSSSNDSLNSSNSKDKAPDTQASENKSVTLVVSGSGINKDEAIKNALRAALEQTYGTFVSSNTQLVNDELAKDEIISVSSGNIEKYSEDSSLLLEDGRYNITLNATVSIGKLMKFAQSKGARTELAGASFAMNMKIRKLEKENEVKTLSVLQNQVLEIIKNGIYDLRITAEEPKACSNQYIKFSHTIPNSEIQKYKQQYMIRVRLDFAPNINAESMVTCIQNTLKGLSLSETDVEEYKKSGLPVYRVGLDGNPRYIPRGTNKDYVYLRNDISKFLNFICLIKNVLACCFEVKDNIGTCIIPSIDAKTAQYNIASILNHNVTISDTHLPIISGAQNCIFRNNFNTDSRAQWYTPFDIERADFHMFFSFFYSEEELVKLSKIEAIFNDKILTALAQQLSGRETENTDKSSGILSKNNSNQIKQEDSPKPPSTSIQIGR